MSAGRAERSARLEAEFNRMAAEEFAAEYEREAGRSVRFKELGDPFPDAILETPDGTEVHVEFVSVMLPFLKQEEDHFNKKYHPRLYAAIQPARPRYRQVAIRLQPNSDVIYGRRPYRLPDVESDDGKQLVLEFRELLGQHFDALSTTHGGLLQQFKRIDGRHAFPMLSSYYSAIILNRIADDDRRRSHPEDPVIEPPTTIYQAGEIADAVCRALVAKAAKGTSYAENVLLVLHTLQVPGKPYVPAANMNPDELVNIAKQFLAHEANPNVAFPEVWLLNAYWTEDGHKLFQLA